MGDNSNNNSNEVGGRASNTRNTRHYSGGISIRKEKPRENIILPQYVKNYKKLAAKLIFKGHAESQIDEIIKKDNNNLYRQVQEWIADDVNKKLLLMISPSNIESVYISTLPIRTSPPPSNLNKPNSNFYTRKLRRSRRSRKSKKT
jgi:hypothetical protein